MKHTVAGVCLWMDHRCDEQVMAERLLLAMEVVANVFESYLDVRAIGYRVVQQKTGEVQSDGGKVARDCAAVRNADADRPVTSSAR